MKRDKRISKWEDRENDFYRALKKKGFPLTSRTSRKSQNSFLRNYCERSEQLLHWEQESKILSIK